MHVKPSRAFVLGNAWYSVPNAEQVTMRPNVQITELLSQLKE